MAKHTATDQACSLATACRSDGGAAAQEMWSRPQWKLGIPYGTTSEHPTSRRIIKENTSENMLEKIHTDRDREKHRTHSTISMNSTQSYEWDDSDFLGSGHFSTVYKCTSRNEAGVTSTVSAAKVFKQEYKSESRVQQDYDVSCEFEILKGLNHANIVRIIAKECEETTCVPVLIMELVSGGSLDSQLSYNRGKECGLCERDFLALLEDGTNGLAFIHNNNILHLDIKPENILYNIGVKGRPIYKIADFGMACKVPAGKCYTTSLACGTSHYMHPKVYDQYLHRDGEMVMEASMDMWSFGVTLYMAATVTIPFSVPSVFKRGDFYQAWLDTISFLEYPQIHASMGESGVTAYSSQFPVTTSLSDGISSQVESFIATLFQSRNTPYCHMREMSIISNRVESLIKRHVRVHIFYMNKCEFLTVGIPEGDLELTRRSRMDKETGGERKDPVLRQLQEIIKCRINISVSNQRIIFNETNTEIDIENALRENTRSNPVFLFDTSAPTHVQWCLKKVPNFPPNLSQIQGIRTAERCAELVSEFACSLAYITECHETGVKGIKINETNLFARMKGSKEILENLKRQIFAALPKHTQMYQPGDSLKTWTGSLRETLSDKRVSLQTHDESSSTKVSSVGVFLPEWKREGFQLAVSELCKYRSVLQKKIIWLDHNIREMKNLSFSRVHKRLPSNATGTYYYEKKKEENAMIGRLVRDASDRMDILHNLEQNIMHSSGFPNGPSASVNTHTLYVTYNGVREALCKTIGMLQKIEQSRLTNLVADYSVASCTFRTQKEHQGLTREIEVLSDSVRHHIAILSDYYS